MSIQAGLFSYLTANAGVAALVGTRVYPLMIPQHVYSEATKLPCLVYQRTGVDRDVTFCGTNTLIRTTMRIDSYAPSYDDAATLAAAVKTALASYTGLMGSVTVKKVLSESEFDLLDIEPGLYRVSQTFSIWHIE